MDVRPATPDDAHALWQAQVATAAVSGQLASRPEEISLVSLDARIRVASQAGCFFVAEADGRLLGHAVLEPMGLIAIQHVYRLTIVVHPRQTGQGIGTTLLKHIQHWAASRPDLHKIELNVRATNASAIRLYTRLGFQVEGRFRDGIRLPTGQLIDDLAMAWFPEVTPSQPSAESELLRASVRIATPRRQVPCSMISTSVQLAPFPDQFRKRLSELVHVIFGGIDSADLEWRLSRLPDASVTVAYVDDNLVGFKLGYATTKTRYYSWLGGVLPDFRRRGIASRLMEAQHDWVRGAGFSVIETTAKPDNAAMLTLNRGVGFTIIGSYARSGQRVLHAKKLDTSDGGPDQ